MVDISRHRSIVNPNNCKYNISVIGCGATGSWLATILAKMGFTNIKLYDFDIVEEHNLANQNYDKNDIGKLKTEALEEKLKIYNDEISVQSINKAVDKTDKLDGIVFLLTDTMSSRKEIYENCIKNNPKVKLLVETRMGSDQCIIYTIEPCRYNQQNCYENTFYNDDEAEVSACGTSITVIPTAMSVASQAVWQMIDFLNDESEIKNNEIMINYRNVDNFKQTF